MIAWQIVNIAQIIILTCIIGLMIVVWDMEIVENHILTVYDTQTMIKKLQEHGYEVTKIEDNAKLYIVHDEDYCWQAVIRAKNYEEAINKLHKWMDENNHNNGEVWNSRNVKWYMDLCDNNEVIR